MARRRGRPRGVESPSMSVRKMRKRKMIMLRRRLKRRILGVSVVGRRVTRRMTVPTIPTIGWTDPLQRKYRVWITSKSVLTSSHRTFIERLR